GLVTGSAGNGIGGHVSVDEFRDTIDAACSAGRAVSLRELVSRSLTGRSTTGLFAVTFDDAFVSLTQPAARGVISAYQLPISIFVVTRASASGTPFWWDRIEALHRQLSAEEWEAFERRIDLPSEFRTPAAMAFGPLRPFRQWVLSRHAGRLPQPVEDVVASLSLIDSSRDMQRPMTFDEIDRFVEEGRVDVGIHTVSHPVLPLLADDEISEEIRSSYMTLRERWPSALPLLAAPFGLYDERTVSISRALGLSGILNLHPATLELASAAHGFPRVGISGATRSWRIAIRLSAFSRFAAALQSRTVNYPPLPTPD